MKITALVKQAGKRKDVLAPTMFQLSRKPETLRELIIEIVSINVKQFNNKPDENTIMGYLTSNEVTEQAEIGKVGFGFKYNGQLQDLSKAIDNAMICFEDGIYRVFINGLEVEKLDNKLEINEGDQVSFIKLVMLAGRLW